jgi:hypothetical protein
MTISAWTAAAAASTAPSTRISIAAKASARIPAYIAKRGLGTHCVLVADDNTYRVAGAEVEKALTGAGFSVVSCVIHREHDMLPDDLSCGEVLLSITGRRSSSSRWAAAPLPIPPASMPNARAAFCFGGHRAFHGRLRLRGGAPAARGLKIKRPAVCPEIIVCDLDVLATAPLP